MSEQKRAQHTFTGILTRVLHIRAIDSYDLIVVGSHSYVVPEALYPTLDILHCGDTVSVTYEVNGRVIALAKKEPDQVCQHCGVVSKPEERWCSCGYRFH